MPALARDKGSTQRQGSRRRERSRACACSPPLPPEQAARVLAMAALLLARWPTLQGALVEALGVRARAISKWGRCPGPSPAWRTFTGRNSPSYGAAMRVAQLAGVSLKELLGPPLPRPMDVIPIK